MGLALQVIYSWKGLPHFVVSILFFDFILMCDERPKGKLLSTLLSMWSTMLMNPWKHFFLKKFTARIFYLHCEYFPKEYIYKTFRQKQARQYRLGIGRRQGNFLGGIGCGIPLITFKKNKTKHSQVGVSMIEVEYTSSYSSFLSSHAASSSPPIPSSESSS